MRSEFGAGVRPIHVRSGPENPMYGKFRGVVTKTNDPAMRGRIKAMVPFPFGDVETDWCEPCFAGNMFDIPPVNAGVWIEFEGGDTRTPIWVGRWYRNGEAPFQYVSENELQQGDEEVSTTPEEDALHLPFHDHRAGERYSPHTRVWRTPSGHYILFDDWVDADSSNKRGYLCIADRNGHRIELHEEGFIDLFVSNGVSLRLDAAGHVYIGDVAGSKRLMTEDDHASLVSLINSLNSSFNAHVHTSAASGSPTTPPTAGISLSLSDGMTTKTKAT